MPWGYGEEACHIRGVSTTLTTEPSVCKSSLAVRLPVLRCSWKRHRAAPPVPPRLSSGISKPEGQVLRSLRKHGGRLAPRTKQNADLPGSPVQVFFERKLSGSKRVEPPFENRLAQQVGKPTSTKRDRTECPIPTVCGTMSQMKAICRRRLCRYSLRPRPPSHGVHPRACVQERAGLGGRDWKTNSSVFFTKPQIEWRDHGTHLKKTSC